MLSFFLQPPLQISNSKQWPPPLSSGFRRTFADLHGGRSFSAMAHSFSQRPYLKPSLSSTSTFSILKAIVGRYIYASSTGIHSSSPPRPTCLRQPTRRSKFPNQDDCDSHRCYMLKVAQLCKDIGLGEPTHTDDIQGGSINRVIGLAFAKYPGQEYVVRIPRLGETIDDPDFIEDGVAILRYLTQFLPVPSVLAYDLTQINALRSSYVIQQRIAGQNCDEAYYDLPLAEKLQVATAVAVTLLKLEALKMPHQVAWLHLDNYLRRHLNLFLMQRQFKFSASSITKLRSPMSCLIYKSNLLQTS